MWAGKNRPELERVLDYFGGEPLKLEAAKFLIRNMPGHYSYRGKEIERYYDAVDSVLLWGRGRTVEEMLDTLEKVSARRAREYPVVQDVEVMKADLLIANIEDAFWLWTEGKWSKHVAFSDFCEFLLPYKVTELQPLDDWRTDLRHRFDKGLERLDYCDVYRHSAVWATCHLNSNMKDSLKPDIRANRMCPIHRMRTLMRMPFGVCRDYVEMATAVLRSEGVPVAVDFTPQWPFRSKGHTWNVVLAGSGKTIPFGGVEGNPGEPHKLDEKMAKVYRKTYAANTELEEVMKAEGNVPPTFRSPFIKDVTDAYMMTSDVEVCVEGVRGGYAYLAVFDDKGWTPVAVGKVKGGKARFKSMGRNILYMPVGYAQGYAQPAGTPFILTATGEVRQIVPRMEEKQPVTLYRKYPVLPHVQGVAHRVLGGRFQASATADFKEAVTLHEIEEWGINGVEVDLPESTGAYRYWRYYQPTADAFCNMAEVAFVERGADRPLTGRIIGMEGSFADDPHTRKEAAFDGDLPTFYDAPVDSCGWIGMDFGRPVAIGQIRYTPRGDGNTIGAGDRYELFYWDNGCWNSLGGQTATTTWLRFEEVPKGALLLLRNLSRGQEERIFLYEGGKQIFW